MPFSVRWFVLPETLEDDPDYDQALNVLITEFGLDCELGREIGPKCTMRLIRQLLSKPFLLPMMCPGENTLVPLGVDVDGGKAFDLLVVVQPTVFKVSGAEFPESFLSDVESIQESWDTSSVPIQYQSLI
jgi:hypothetical protein